MRSILAGVITVAATLIASSAAAESPTTKSTAPPVPVNWGSFKASPYPPDQKLVSRIEKMEWWKACETWGRQARKESDPRLRVALLHFLRDGQFINGTDLVHVTDRTAAVGMTFCGVVASMGMPESVNQTQTATRHHSQMVYRSRHTYVYTDGSDVNGIVTSVQF